MAGSEGVDGVIVSRRLDNRCAKASLRTFLLRLVLSLFFFSFSLGLSLLDSLFSSRILHLSYSSSFDFTIFLHATHIGNATKHIGIGVFSLCFLFSLLLH